MAAALFPTQRRWRCLARRRREPGQRPAARHQRSASVGWAPGGGGGGGAWWGGGAGAAAGSPLCGAAGGGGRGLLQLTGSWGGALGALVSESLGGSHRASLCLDAPPLSRAPSCGGSAAGGLGAACLICLDAVAPGELEAGEALHQDCACKGDVALRHARCALQWARVKRSAVCDVCRLPIANLPGGADALGALAPGDAAAGGGGAGGGASGDAWDPLTLGEPPTLRGAAADALRVMWVTAAVALLLFGLQLGRALAAGAAVGASFAAAARALALARRSAAAVHAFAGALRERAWVRAQRLQQEQRRAAAAAAAAVLAGAQWGDSPRAGGLPPVAELRPLSPPPGVDDAPPPPAAPSPFAAAAQAVAAVGGGDGGWLAGPGGGRAMRRARSSTGAAPGGGGGGGSGGGGGGGAVALTVRPSEGEAQLL
ncbi:MAG: hypothetical protein J3K34DRAFT_491441 [Monoraphidium minutum]|nr:MAG: hypothetical protein J3K34DRAFT_491441 [Monoraphidium minutum]